MMVVKHHDSGGVASGPMTATFLLPLATGACVAINGEEEVMRFAYGLVAMVAMTPLIVLQALGLLSAWNAKLAARRLRKTPVAPPVVAETPVSAPVSAQVPPAPESTPAAADEIDVIDL